MASQTQAHTEEKIFRKYTPDQAKAYAAGRLSYHANLYKAIFDHHASTSGEFHTLIDVGCGPGNATRLLAKRFNTAYGVDPSHEMINTAKNISEEADGGETASGKRIQWVERRAEDLAGSTWGGEDKVDMLTAGLAAHWFDMPSFWSSAARVLKKNGTVAVWTTSVAYPHPSTPNYAKVRETNARLEREYFSTHELPGNRLARDAYRNLPLPWDVEPPVEGFSQKGYTRLDWDLDGHLSDGEHFFLGDRPMTVTKMQQLLATASQVTRWREEHPQLANTEEDIVVKATEELRRELGRDELVMGNSCTILLFKRD